MDKQQGTASGILQGVTRGRKLILASNRAPYTPRVRDGIVRWDLSLGGLVTALDPVMQSVGGVWVAWEEVPGGKTRARVPKNSPRYDLRLLSLTQSEIEGYYLGFANRVLWPMCHFTLDRVKFRHRYWLNYARVNDRFAEVIAEEAAVSDSLVWIHDYHLALVPRLLRTRAPRLPVNLFWHIPWPSYDVLRINPRKREILEGLLGADLLGFQTPLFCRNFIDCCAQEFGRDAVIQGDTVVFQDRITRVQALPISIDYEKMCALASSEVARMTAQGIRARYAPKEGMRIGVGVDRLDYTKGFLKRLDAIELLFQRFPEYIRRFTFIQVAIPSRTKIAAYLDYRRQIVARVDEINRKFGREKWRPIEFVTTRQTQAQLAAYYRAADVALVTSVYDGMNLVAKEFVSCQMDYRGVLLLSELAGAYGELTDAVPINPYDAEGVAAALCSSLEMHAGEKEKRLLRMQAYLARNTIFDWLGRNFSAMTGILDARKD